MKTFLTVWFILTLALFIDVAYERAKLEKCMDNYAPTQGCIIPWYAQ